MQNFVRRLSLAVDVIGKNRGELVMYIPVYLPKYDEIRLVFPLSELNAAGLVVQNLLMLSRQEGSAAPSNIETAFKDASQKGQELCLDFGRKHREFAIRIIESVIEVQEKDGEDAESLKEFLSELENFEGQRLH